MKVFGFCLLFALSIMMCGCDSTAPEPANSPPVANFEVSTAELTVSFRDQSIDGDGSITAWDWDFGDNEKAAIPDPVHDYAVGGTYTVILTVTDDKSTSHSVSKVVEVHGPLDGTWSGPYDTSVSFLGGTQRRDCHSETMAQLGGPSNAISGTAQTITQCTNFERNPVTGQFVETSRSEDTQDMVITGTVEGSTVSLKYGSADFTAILNGEALSGILNFGSGPQGSCLCVNVTLRRIAST